MFVESLYAEFHGESIPKEEILRICKDIENCVNCETCENCDAEFQGETNLKEEILRICEDIENCVNCETCEHCEDCELKKEILSICADIVNCANCDTCDSCENCDLKQEPEDFDNDGLENYGEEGSELRKDDTESDTSILAYKFATMISGGEFDKLAEEEFNTKRPVFPSYINIDKRTISEALSTLKVQFLDEEYRSSQLIGKRKYTISCTICPYKKNQRSLMMKHLRVHFKKMYWCTPCSKSVTEISNHIRTKHSEKSDSVWVCEVSGCNKSLKTEYNLTLHKKTHDMVSCDQCDYKCEGRKRLQSHMARKHAETKKDPYVCHVCSKSLSSSQQLKSHLQIHGDEEFRCEPCQKTFKVEKNLRKHIMMHHKEKNFVCETCGETFSVKYHHDKHVLLKHTKKKNFNCVEVDCDYQGATKNYLQKHMETHAEAKLSCTHCGKKFRQPGALKSHMMTHTGERPYACTECSYRCIQPFDLRKHFLKQHNKVIEKPSLYMSSNTHNSDKKE